MNANTYFTSRYGAGETIAASLTEFTAENSALLSISSGGYSVGQAIAKKLALEHHHLSLLTVSLSGDSRVLGTMSSNGTFTRNLAITESEYEDIILEYHSVIESTKSAVLHTLHSTDEHEQIDPHLYTDKNVLVVTDYADTGTAFRAAIDFLKPIKTRKLVLITVIAHINAVDVMHLLGDKLLVLHTTDNDFPAEHYFADNTTN